MGYRTQYSLDLPDADRESIEKIRSEEEGFYARLLDVEYEAKWYGHEDDMRSLSARYPGVVFLLHGEGEEQGDVWNKYFLEGKMQHCPARIEFDPFDPKKLG